jgi:DNA polymerase-3 subunit alpha
MVRRAISKKKAQEIQKEENAFIYGDPQRGIRGCIANGIPEDTAKAIYGEIYDFANYAFNKAHAVSYAIVAYHTAWCKRHHPRPFMAALLTSVLDSQDKIGEYIRECKESGIAVLPPDINQSGPDFTVSGDTIRFGLSALKGVGRGFTRAILAERDGGGAFATFPDFCERMQEADLNKRVLESLIRSGAFDSMGYRRSQLMDVCEPYLDNLTRNRRKNVAGQFDLFSENGGGAGELPLADIPEFSPAELLRMEKEVTGLYLSGHPMDAYRGAAKRTGAAAIGAILADFKQDAGAEPRAAVYHDNQVVTLAGIITAAKTKTTRNDSLMAYITLEDDSGSMELLAFSRVLEQSGPYVKAGTPVAAKGRISVREDKPPQLLCDELRPLANLPGVQTQEEAPAETPAPQGAKLYLKLPSQGSPLFDKIGKILMMFPGDTPVVLYCADTKRRLGTRCGPQEILLHELRELLGAESVVLR